MSTAVWIAFAENINALAAVGTLCLGVVQLVLLYKVKGNTNGLLEQARRQALLNGYREGVEDQKDKNGVAR